MLNMLGSQGNLTWLRAASRNIISQKLNESENEWIARNNNDLGDNDYDYT